MPLRDDALEQAIRAAPDDDAPRLIYADWLEEHDQYEQAAKIRQWVNEIEPKAIKAYKSSSKRKLDLTKEANKLQKVPGEWWRLAAVLLQRLIEQDYLIKYDLITTWPDGWSSERHRQAVLDCRHKTELFSLGLESSMESAAESAEAAARAAWSAWSAARAAASAAAWSAAASAGAAEARSAAESAWAAAWAAAMVAKSAAKSAAESAAWAAACRVYRAVRLSLKVAV